MYTWVTACSIIVIIRVAVGPALHKETDAVEIYIPIRRASADGEDALGRKPADDYEAL